MFGWLQRWREDKALVQAEATCLIQEHGGQARYVLAEQIRELEARNEPSKELWKVMREVRKRTGSEGLNTGTRYIDSEKP